MGDIKRESANFERGEMGPNKSVLNGRITFYLSQLAAKEAIVVVGLMNVTVICCELRQWTYTVVTNTTKFILYLECILNISPSSIDRCFLSVCLLSILGASANNFIV